MGPSDDEIEWLEAGPDPVPAREARRRTPARPGDGIFWLGPLSGPPPPRPGTRLNVAVLSTRDRDWHRGLITREKPRKVKFKTSHLLGLNLCAAAMFGYFRYLLNASRGSPLAVGLMVVGSLALVVAMIAGAIVLHRLSSSYLRRSENRSGRSGLAFEMASMMALVGSVALVALLIVLGGGFAVLVFNGLVEGQ